MAKAVELKVGDDLRELVAVLRSVVDQSELYRAIARFFDRRGARIAARIVKEKLSGQSLNRRTGALARSIVGEGGIINGVPGLRVGVLRGPSLPYAAALEYGTKGANPASPIPTIRPRKAKALAVPVNDALTPAGVARYPSPRTYPGKLRFVPFNRRSNQRVIGALYDAAKLRAAGDRLEAVKALWLLMTELDLEPRFYLRDVFFDDLESLVRDLTEFLVSLIGGDGPGRRIA